MRLFYFTTAEHGLDAIARRRLKIAKLDALDDPFEFMGLALKRPHDREAFHGWKQDMAVHYGVLCLSARWDHPLLWSHYGDRHKGMCLGFDVDDRFIDKVRYFAKRPTLKKLGIANIAELNADHLKRVASMKYAAWRYEREARLYIRFDFPTVAAKLEFIDFSDALALRQVIVGAASPVSRTDVQQASQGLTDVETFKTRMALRSFRVAKNRNAAQWV